VTARPTPRPAPRLAPPCGHRRRTCGPPAQPGARVTVSVLLSLLKSHASHLGANVHQPGHVQQGGERDLALSKGLAEREVVLVVDRRLVIRAAAGDVVGLKRLPPRRAGVWLVRDGQGDRASHLEQVEHIARPLGRQVLPERVRAQRVDFGN
jgi:hypothetical protein